MAVYTLKISEEELRGTYTPSFTPTETDWYEWRANAVNTFATRIQDAIDADATMAAYSPVTYVMYDDSTKRLNLSDDLGITGTVIVIHSLTEDTQEENTGSARYRLILGARITALVRREGLDTDNREIGVLGDGTADSPGVVEVMKDLRSLLRTNYLESGGVRYIWHMKVGPIARDETFEDMGPDIYKYTMDVEGWKDDNLV